MVSNTSPTWVESGSVSGEAVTKYYTFAGQKACPELAEGLPCAKALAHLQMMGYITWVATAVPASPVLGSTSLTTDSSGGIISEVRYKPYGEERWSNGTAVTDFGFTSQRNERGFGLMDYNARYYSPTLGRFISPDTIVPEPGSSGGFNRYRYTRNNPLKYTDPSGHCVSCLDDPSGRDLEHARLVNQEWHKARSAYGKDYKWFITSRDQFYTYAENVDLLVKDLPYENYDRDIGKKLSNASGYTQNVLNKQFPENILTLERAWNELTKAETSGTHTQEEIMFWKMQVTNYLEGGGPGGAAVTKPAGLPQLIEKGIDAGGVLDKVDEYGREYLENFDVSEFIPDMDKGKKERCKSVGGIADC